MKRQIWTLLIGLALGIAVVVPLTAWASGHGQGATDDDAHSQMHAMMDSMHGEGFTDRMHEEMPGSEEMMDGMDGMEESGMGGMMNMMRGMR